MRAIEVLKNEVVKCNYMNKFYDEQLEKNCGITADEMEIQRYKSEKAELEKVKEDCLYAIEYLKTLP